MGTCNYTYVKEGDWMLTEEQVDEIIVNCSGDVWKQIASKENNIPYEEVSQSQRDAAKMTYFSTMYRGLNNE